MTIGLAACWVLVYSSTLICTTAAATSSPTAKTLSPSSSIILHEVFVKCQLSVFYSRPSDNFVYVPNLNEAFHLTRNTLFKLTLQGHFGKNSLHLDQFVQIMVNDHLIIGDKLVPNTNQRNNYGVGSDLIAVDINGGYFYSASVRSVIPITRVAFVYLPPGTYSFNVGTRSNAETGQFNNGILTFEVTQFENGGLKSVGGYQLASFPKEGRT